MRFCTGRHLALAEARPSKYKSLSIGEYTLIIPGFLSIRYQKGMRFSENLECDRVPHPRPQVAMGCHSSKRKITKDVILWGWTET